MMRFSILRILIIVGVLSMWLAMWVTMARGWIVYEASRGPAMQAPDEVVWVTTAFCAALLVAFALVLVAGLIDFSGWVEKKLRPPESDESN